MIQNHIVLFTRGTLVIADDIEGTLEGIYVHKGAPCGDYFNKFISSTQSSGISEDNLSIESILSS